MAEPAPSRQRPSGEPAAQGSSLERTADPSDLNVALLELRAQAQGLGRNALLALLRADQCRGWVRGRRVRVEWYLGHFPILAGDAQAVLALIANEIALRRQAGDLPSLAEYVERFPGHAAALRDHRGLEAPVPEWEVTRTVAIPGQQMPAEGARGSPPAAPADNPGLGAPGDGTLDRPVADLATPADGPAPAARAGPPAAEGRGPTLPPGTLSRAPEGAAAAAGAGATAHAAIPGYEVLEEVGRGGMGVVYKARQLRLNRMVALKMIRAGAQGSPEHVTRFRLEAEAVARLRHPNIVQIYEVGEYQGRPFCCLEFVEGGGLDRHLGGAPQPVRAAAGLLETLARAMHAAHQEGIVHRDLKPGNILISAGGVPKISDFGLAKQLDDDSWKTTSGVIMGTPSYMAPEQAAGQNKEVGPLTDVYALGTILYELLTGRPPFRAETMLETLDQVRTQEPVPPRRLQPKVPRDLETICLKCLQKEAAKRYASALDLAEDVGRFLNDEPIRGRPVPGWERLVKWVRRRPAAAALIVVSAVAFLSAVLGSLAYLGKRAGDADARAQAAKQALADAQRSDEVRQLVHDGQTAAQARDWPKARELGERALALIGPQEEALGPLRDQAQRLRDEAAGHQQAEDRFQQFTKERDEVLFQATLATGEGSQANVRQTRAAAPRTLALARMSLGGQAPLAPDPYWTAEENATAAAGCYELLLVLAEAEGHPLLGEEPEPQLRQALRLLDRAASLGWSSHPTQAYHLRRARYLEQLGDQAEAQQERRRAAERPPTTALDHYLLGDAEYKQRHFAEAVRHFENALAVQPDHFWARYFLSMGYLQLGRAAEARAGLTACLGQGRDLQRRDLIPIYLHILRGYANIRLKEFKAAEEDFQSALQLQPGADAAHVLYANRAVLWFRQDKFGQAEADLRQAIALKKEDYQAHVNLAQVYQKEKKWADAAGQLDQAIGLEPDLAVLYRLRARLEQESPEPDLEAALRDCDKAIAIEGRSGPSLELAEDHAERGRILQRRRQYAQAVAAYDAALKVPPGLAGARLGRADAELELGNYNEALASLDDYLKKGGQPRAEVYRARGLARAKLGRHAEAIDDYGRALEANPKDEERAPLHLSRGGEYLAINALEPALRDFEEAVRLDSTSADAWLACAQVRVQLGDAEKGVADAERAVQGGPKEPRPWHGAARVYVQAAGHLKAEHGHEERQVRMRLLYLRRAVALLRTALDLLTADQQRQAYWRENVLTDAALDPLRGLPEFVRLGDGLDSRER
jgi:tetratricopeptide (TPR) repeat protein